MIGCVLLGAAGLFLAAKMIRRHHYGWHGRYYGGGWGGGCGSFRSRLGHGGWGHGCPDCGADGPGGPGGWDGERMAGEPDGGGGGGVRLDGLDWRQHLGERFLMRTLAERLGTTPEQDKVIRDAFDELREAARGVRGEGKKTREETADAFRKPMFDEVLFGEMFARHDRSLENLRKAFVGAGARIHGALDDRQREILADLLQAGPRRWRREGRRHGFGWRHHQHHNHHHHDHRSGPFGGQPGDGSHQGPRW